MVRVVFDAVVFVRCLLNRHSLWGTLVFDRSADYRLVVSPPVLKEVLGVLHRPELVIRFSTLPGRDARAVLAILDGAEVVSLDEASIAPISRDPKDDKYPATAAAGDADFLVSEDNDLLVLGEYEGVRIVTAATFLTALENAPDTPR